MCGRYGGPRDAEVHAGFLDVTQPFAGLPTYQEYRPTDMAPVFVKNRAGQVVIKAMRWWLVPATFKAALKDWRATTFNARLDEIRTKSSFRRPWDLKRRVVVPAAHYYEWTGQSGNKTPWRITRTDFAPLAFAGLWDHAETADGPVLSFAILTREPGPVMRTLHPREPVVLDPYHWQAWLDGADDLPLATAWANDRFTIEAA